MLLCISLVEMLIGEPNRSHLDLKNDIVDIPQPILDRAQVMSRLFCQILYHHLLIFHSISLTMVTPNNSSTNGIHKNI